MNCAGGIRCSATALACSRSSAGGLAVFGLFQPAAAAGIARLLFGLVALFGYVLIFVLWREGGARARASMFTWSILLIWTVVAAFAVLDIVSWPAARLILAAGLALVLLTLGFTLAQFAFSHGILSSRFFEDFGQTCARPCRRGADRVGLAGRSRRPVCRSRARTRLGLEAGAVTGRGLKSWIELIHPADRAGYVAAVEAAERRGRGTVLAGVPAAPARWNVSLVFAARPGGGRTGRPRFALYRDFGRHYGHEASGGTSAVRCRSRPGDWPAQSGFVHRSTGSRHAAGAYGDNRELYVIVIDLDRFKTVNEGLGFEAGDSLLSVTARRLAGLIGPEDTLARLPGDQFGVIFNGKKPKRDVIPFAEQLRGALSRPDSAAQP